MSTEKEAFEECFKKTDFYKMNLVNCFCFINDRYVWDEVQAAWQMWQESKAHTVLENDCMIEKTWFMKGSRVAALVKYAENVYKAEAVAQNSKIEFGTDDNEIWWAHEVPFFGTVQMDKIVEHGLTEWDIYLDGCWQGPFSSQSKAIQHLEECIKEKMEENA